MFGSVLVSFGFSSVISSNSSGTIIKGSASIPKSSNFANLLPIVVLPSLGSSSPSAIFSEDNADKEVYETE